MNMNTTTTQTQKSHGVGFLLAAPFVLSWEMVTFLWSVLMKIRAIDSTPTKAEAAQRAQDEERREQEHQLRMAEIYRISARDEHDSVYHW